MPPKYWWCVEQLCKYHLRPLQVLLILVLLRKNDTLIRHLTDDKILQKGSCFFVNLNKRTFSLLKLTLHPKKKKEKKNAFLVLLQRLHFIQQLRARQGFFNFFVSLKNQITIKVTTKISPNFKSLHYSIHVIYRNFSV